MKITLTLVADCDEPPEPVGRSLDEALDGLLSTLEDLFGALLLDLGAGFAIDSDKWVEP